MSTNDKSIILTQDNPANLPTDTMGNEADVVIQDQETTELMDNKSNNHQLRYTEADALKEAGTDAHTDLENADLLKARVLEVVNTDTSFAGITKHVSLILWETVSNELHAVTGQLRTAKTNEERVALLEKISNHHHRLGIITDNFLE